LEERPDAKLAVYAIWLPMLGGDARDEWDPAVLDDERVAHFWDEERVSGKWLGDHETGDLGSPGGVVWDAYLLFGPDARWEDEPSELVAAGAPIIGETDELGRETAKLVD
jgi:hypothetical protein